MRKLKHTLELFPTLLVLILVGVVGLLQPNIAIADPDMWTALAEKEGLFSPHQNNCDGSTEVYLSVAGGTAGFCMEKTTRSSAYFGDAKETCASVGKRLPELMEWIYACKNPPSGLTNMSSSEWGGNTPLYDDQGGGVEGFFATTLGYSACSNAGRASIARSDSNQATAAFGN